jgi:hypothetical protein
VVSRFLLISGHRPQKLAGSFLIFIIHDGKAPISFNISTVFSMGSPTTLL